MSSLKALKELKENIQYECKWRLYRLNIIEKDLEILYMLKKNMRVKSEPLKTFNNRIIEYEYIAYNDRELNIKTKEEYNKVKDWLLDNDL